MKNENEVAVSILDIDICNIKKTIDSINSSSASSIHYDVMDGTFVKNISFGNLFLDKIAKLIKIPIDVHLMINDPINKIKNYIDNADLIYIHFESLYYYEITNLLLEIKKNNVKAGIAVKPNTNIEQIYEYLKYCDEILIMSVEPGLGGQAFIEPMLNKISTLSKNIKLNKFNVKISVDGGVNEKYAKLCKEYGANKVIAGNYIINNKSLTINNAINSLR